MGAKIEPTKLLMEAVLVAFIGGIAALIGGMALALISPIFGVLAQVVLSIIAIVLAVWLAKWGKVDNMSWFHALIFLAALAVVGTLITAFLPFASAYILAIQAVSIPGFLWTLVWILAGETLLLKAGYR